MPPSTLTLPATVNPSVVIVPTLSMFPVPVILFEFKSRLPPNCGVVSSTTFDNPP